MKRIISFSIVAFLNCISTVCFAANTGDPEEVNVRVYSMWASPNANCTNAIQVFKDDDPAYKNIHGSPDFGAGILDNGAYPCVAIQIHETIKFKPAFNSDVGNCVQGTEYTINIFQQSDTSICPDGSTFSGQTDHTPCIFFSTKGNDDPDSVGNTAYQAPGFKLSHPWTVNSNKSGTLVIDFSGKVEDTGVLFSNGKCDAGAPKFGFR